MYKKNITSFLDISYSFYNTCKLTCLKASCLPREAILEVWDDMICCSGTGLLVPLAVALLEFVQESLLQSSGSDILYLGVVNYIQWLGGETSNIFFYFQAHLGKMIQFD